MKVLGRSQKCFTIYYYMPIYHAGHVMCILYKTLSKNIFMPPILLCMGGRCIDICILEIFGSEVP